MRQRRLLLAAVSRVAVDQEHLGRLLRVGVRAQHNVRAGSHQGARHPHLAHRGVPCAQTAEREWRDEMCVHAAALHALLLAPSNSWPQWMDTMRRPQPAAAMSRRAAHASLWW